MWAGPGVRGYFGYCTLFRVIYIIICNCNPSVLISLITKHSRSNASEDVDKLSNLVKSCVLYFLHLRSFSFIPLYVGSVLILVRSPLCFPLGFSEQVVSEPMVCGLGEYSLTLYRKSSRRRFQASVSHISV